MQKSLWYLLADVLYIVSNESVKLLSDFVIVRLLNVCSFVILAMIEAEKISLTTKIPIGVLHFCLT